MAPSPLSGSGAVPDFIAAVTTPATSGIFTGHGTQVTTVPASPPGLPQPTGGLIDVTAPVDVNHLYLAQQNAVMRTTQAATHGKGWEITSGGRHRTPPPQPPPDGKPTSSGRHGPHWVPPPFRHRPSSGHPPPGTMPPAWALK
jgi:hypothetical protein